jgi:hypothetical protein
MANATFTEFFKAASPLRGGSPGQSLAGGTWGVTAIGGTVGVSTTLASCVMFLAQTYTEFVASGVIVTMLSAPIVTITAPGLCSGSWIAIGY